SGEGSDVVQKETYTFDDRGSRSLTLRPEGTAPICRVCVEHGVHREPQLQKLYTIAPMWRYDRPQKGRYREHWQLSVEAIGSAGPEEFAEVRALLDAFADPYEVVPTLVRGLDYYTRTAFEFRDAEGTVICGGGRYDGLIEAIGGPTTPGIGFGAGLERLELVLPGEPPQPTIAVFFVLDEGADHVRVQQLLAELRARG